MKYTENQYIMYVMMMVLVMMLTSVVSASYYDISQHSSYTWGKEYPQSCQCAESGVSLASCNLFQCKCTCDVTAGKCDYNCCCDPDCTADQISRFRSLGNCAYEGFVPDSEEFCYRSSELYAVNPRSPMGGDPTAQEGVGRALCVEKKNYAFKSDFYEDIGLQSSQIFKQATGQKPYSYTDSSQISVSTVAADQYFDQNDTIAAFLVNTAVSASSLFSSGPGYLQLPVADVSSLCNDMNYATFENDVDATNNVCSRKLQVDNSAVDKDSVFADQCQSLNSVAKFVSSLYVAKSSATVASTGVVAMKDVLPVQLATITHYSRASGVSTDITALWTANSCATTAMNTVTDINAAKGVCYFSNVTYANTDEVFLCSNMVQSVVYHVNHSSSSVGTILAVTAEVVVTDVDIIIPATATTTVFSAALSQSFGVDYSSHDPADISNANGNVVKRQRSGNPGYLMGKPVLFGFRNTSGTAVQELVEGLTLPISTGLGLCPDGSQPISNAATSFGYDTISGCRLVLNRQQMKDFCCTGASGSCLDNALNSVLFDSAYVNKANGIAYFLNITPGLIGIYGDADPLDITQWNAMEIAVPADERQWSDITSTCSKVFSGVQLKLLISATGEKQNPQNKIISALAEVITSDWQFNVPVGDNSTTQAFQLSVVTSYIFVDEQTLVGYEPPAPPALFKVPYDVFYPFLTGAASSSASASTMTLVVSLTLMVVLTSTFLASWT